MRSLRQRLTTMSRTAEQQSPSRTITGPEAQLASPRRIVGAGLMLLVVAGLATGCSSPEAEVYGTRDVGSMAFPAPLPQGDIGTTTVVDRKPSDTGNMAYPDPVPQGVVGRAAVTRQGFDTGSMAFPTPRPEGNVATTIVR